MNIENIIDSIITEFENINCSSDGSNTQKTAKNHESNVKDILEKNNISSVDKDNFKKLLDINFGIKLHKIDFKNSYEKTESNKINNFNIENEELLFVHQPRGSQAYPDFIIFKIKNSESNKAGKIKMLYLECKQKKPTFNNTPPKNKDHCLYLCGNDLYSGSELMNEITEQALSDFYKEELERRTIFNNRPEIAVKITPLKGNELKSFPPIFFDKEKNLEKIKSCFTYVLN